MTEFSSLPQSEACRIINFEKAQVHKVNGAWVLSVNGTKPWINMEVKLAALIYIRQPEYWGIEVVGCLSGVGLPAIAPYYVSLPIASFLGTKGIEVIGASRTEKIDVP